MRENPVSRAMEDMLSLLEEQAFEKDAESLQAFYASVKKRAEGIDNAEGKQRIIIELYDKFFKTAFPKLVEKLGIVYTPVEVVDYIIHSVDDLLKLEFGKSLSSEGVHVLDPFTGTGTFITRILQSGLIKPEDLKRKYTQELHANEIVLLAYYIAAINAENAYHDLLDEGEAYVPFDGICLTDTFQLGEADGSGTLYSDMFPKNSSRVEAQKKSKIQVIVGNPPYSIGQGDQNDNAQNQDYPLLHQQIADTYASQSNSNQVRSLYDSYIKAFKWSTQRLDNEEGGIIGFVTNGSWIDGTSQDGMRKCLAKEFTSIYVFNLRGNQRTSGEKSRQEGGKIFGSGSRTPVSICFLVKNPKVKVDEATIYYRDIGDYLTREEKLSIVSSAGSMLSKEMKWKVIKPNKAGDWINKRSDSFKTMIPLGDKKGKSNHTVFKPVYSTGINTARDWWTYGYSRAELERRGALLVENFNSESIRYSSAKSDSKPSDFVNNSADFVSWDPKFFAQVEKGIRKKWQPDSIIEGLYRPFEKRLLAFDHQLIARPSNHDNYSDIDTRVLLVSNKGEFSALMTKSVANYGTLTSCQCFPLWYRDESSSDGLFASEGMKCGLSDWFLAQVREKFGNHLTPEDLLDFVYGLLHHPGYRKAFENDVKKELARVTLEVTPEEFNLLKDAGSRLSQLHIDYENVDPHPDVVVYGEDWQDFKVSKLKYVKGRKDQIQYNDHITITNIPVAAHEYMISGRSSLWWLLDRFMVDVDKSKNRICERPQRLVGRGR